MTTPAPPAHLVRRAVADALAEDLGLAGDVTTAATIGPETPARAVIAARADGVVAGAPVAVEAFAQVDPAIAVSIETGDGARVARGDVVMRLEGPARGVLTAERVALNFLGHLSGVATATAALVDAVAGTRATIVGTRKTTPGLRALEKYAVRCGGGANHRFGLFDGAMIKDNHIAAAGGIAPAVAACRKALGHMAKVEVEIDRLDQLEEALGAGADVIMLDNMATTDMAAAVKIVAGRAVLEASGNVTVQTVRAIAETGVDVISSGWITHSAPCLDLGMDFL